MSFPGFPPPMMGRAVTAFGGSVTWNPADASSANRTVGAGSGGLCRGTASRSSGKWKFEVTCLATPQAGDGIGAALASASLAASIGSTGSAGYNTAGGVNINNTSVATLATYTTGDIISVEVDFTGSLIFFQRLGSARDTGRSIASLVGALFPFVGFSAASSYTLNTGNAIFAIPISPGFTNWG
jgi:hypothetical protein